MTAIATSGRQIPPGITCHYHAKGRHYGVNEEGLAVLRNCFALLLSMKVLNWSSLARLFALRSQAVLNRVGRWRTDLDYFSFQKQIFF